MAGRPGRRPPGTARRQTGGLPIPKFRSLPARAVLAGLAALVAGPAAASSEEAWAEFRSDVETSCRALLDTPGTPSVRVNPFGSDRFGLALITVTLEDGTADLYGCIYDKQAKTAELTAPFPAEPAPDGAAPDTAAPGEAAP